jgi:hypothetical protein
VCRVRHVFGMFWSCVEWRRSPGLARDSSGDGGFVSLRCVAGTVVFGGVLCRPFLHNKGKKITLPPSIFTKVCFSSLNSKTRQNISLNF